MWQILADCGSLWEMDPPLTIVLLPLNDQLELKARQTKHDLGQSIDHLDLVALSTFQEKIVLQFQEVDPCTF